MNTEISGQSRSNKWKDFHFEFTFSGVQFLLNPINHFRLCLLLSGMCIATNAVSQSKFEISVGIDPLMVPVNAGTYVEHGQGYYDINGRGMISQSGSAYFAYWPLKAIGVSVGVITRNFGSQIDYAIPDPIYGSTEPFLEGSYPFKANGWGNSFSLLFRQKRWRARIGLAHFELNDKEYDSRLGISTVSLWDGGEKVAEIQTKEKAYWNTAPNFYHFLQVEGQYFILKNLFVKLSFETTISSNYPYPYTLEIAGFTPETSPDVQVFNDYEMRNSLSSISFGVGYVLGFGHYNKVAD